MLAHRDKQSYVTDQDFHQERMSSTADPERTYVGTELSNRQPNEAYNGAFANTFMALNDNFNSHSTGNARSRGSGNCNGNGLPKPHDVSTDLHVFEDDTNMLLERITPKDEIDYLIRHPTVKFTLLIASIIVSTVLVATFLWSIPCHLNPCGRAGKLQTTRIPSNATTNGTLTSEKHTLNSALATSPVTFVNIETTTSSKHTSVSSSDAGQSRSHGPYRVVLMGSRQ